MNDGYYQLFLETGNPLFYTLAKTDAAAQSGGAPQELPADGQSGAQ